MKAPLILIAILLLIAPASAGESGVTLERGDAVQAETNRERLARGIYRHTFENVRDPDTGSMLPESASLNPDNWPDFWEPIRAVGFPEYLIPTVKVVPGGDGVIPGIYRDVPNHVLSLDFDGTRIGLRTRVPVPIDPGLAYEYSLFLRDNDLQGGRIRTGVDWMRIDPAATTVLRSDTVPGLTPGQADWPVIPFTMLVNDPPPEANAARLFIIVDRDPESVGGAYHGSISIDDVALKPLPKIVMGAPRAADGSDRVIPVHYQGLFDNIPDPDNPGYFRGSRYSRRVEITDVFGVPVQLTPELNDRAVLSEEGVAVEEIPFPRDKYGVYYFTIRLFDAFGRMLTNVIRSVAVMRPLRQRDDLAVRSIQPVFGITADPVPESILTRPGFLRTILERSGVKMTKINPWRRNNLDGRGNEFYYTRLIDEIRHLRSVGIGVTGVIGPPESLSEDGRLDTAIETNPDGLNAMLAEAGRRLGLFIDSWQMGRDGDSSFSTFPRSENVDKLLATLRDFAGGMPMIANVPLSSEPMPNFPARPEIVQANLSDMTPPSRLWQYASELFPWLFEPYFNRRGAIYPPAELSALAPQPALDRLEEEARRARRTGAWIAVEVPPARQFGPDVASEHVQLEEIMMRGIVAAILRPDAVHLGTLFDQTRGMLRLDATGNNTLETMARPIFLAARTLSEFLEGGEYLGRLWLLPPFEAHVFRQPGTNNGVIALWHNDHQGERMLAHAEIANGPALELVDWAGNRTPITSAIPVRRVPVFITGMAADLLLTRMSMRVMPEPPIMAQNRRQTQTIEMVNHMSRQAPILMRLRYAARLPDGGMENNWMIKPTEMRLNLPPNRDSPQAGRVNYETTPDSFSQIQVAGPNGVDKSGLKIAQARVTFNTMPPADMMMFLPFNLRSDLDVDIEPLPRVGDNQFVTLQLKIRWFPTSEDRRRGEIRLTPFSMKRGQMKEAAPFPVTVKALPPEMRGNPDAPFESIELRIPRHPPARTWVGVDEAGGSRFYIADVTGFLGEF